jgi:hypothetical protein
MELLTFSMSFVSEQGLRITPHERVGDKDPPTDPLRVKAREDEALVRKPLLSKVCPEFELLAN